jgi:exonuclease III
VIENDERKFIVVNAYFTNDHKHGATFAEQMYTKVLKVQAKYPDHITFCAGDMNVCLSSNDSLNRIGLKNEDLMSDVIRNNNKVAKLSDAYRLVHATGGYTWKRGIIYLRLTTFLCQIQSYLKYPVPPLTGHLSHLTMLL